MANAAALPPITNKQWDDLLKAGFLAESLVPQYYHLKMGDVVDRLLDGTHNLTAMFGHIFAPSNATTVLGALQAYLPTRPHDNQAYPYCLTWYIGGAITILVVCGRFYGRKCITKVIRPEDWMALVVLMMAIILSVACALSTGVGFAGSHLYDISYNNVITNMKFVFTAELLYFIVIGVVRFQVLVFYLGLSPTKTFRWAVFSVMAFNFMLDASAIFASIFQCKPIAWWNVPITAKCIDRVTAWAAFAGLGIATDLITLLLPMPVVWGLHMNKREKIVVCAIFAVGCMVWVGSINRLRTINEFIRNPDVTYTEGIHGMWSLIEIDLAIIASSVPALRAVAVKHFPWLLGRSKSGSSAYPSGSKSSERPKWKGGAGDTGKAGSWRVFNSRNDIVLEEEMKITVSSGVTVTSVTDDVENGSEKNLASPDVARYNTWARH